jgi:hypothetical protein
MEVLDSVGTVELAVPHQAVRAAVNVVGTGTAQTLRPYRGYAAALSCAGDSSITWTPHQLLKPKLTVNVGSVPSAEDIAQAVWGMKNGIETGWTPRESMRILAAALAGKSSNGGKTFRSITDAKDRIVGTVDGSGNRTAITLDPL